VVRSYWKMFYPIFCAVIVSGCISNASSALKDQDNGQLPAMINPSYLESESAATGANESSIAEPASAEQAKIERASSSRLKPIQWPISGIDAQIVLEARFSDKDKVTVSAERMPLVDFLHYVFGELLGVNYVFDQLIADSTTDINKEVVTLNIADQMSSRELFKLASNLLADRGLQIKYGGNVFYIHTDDDPSASQKNVIGVGGNVGDVPNTTRPILQIVPLKYGAKISVERSLRTFGKAKIVTEYDQGAVFISGNRGDVIQAVE
jgi:general secretion pathway protein D